MAVLVNFKTCDNAKECSGIQECPVGAFYWDEENSTIAIKDNVCTLCGICESACPVGAIKVARTEEELNNIRDEYDKDVRTIEELFIDRYGAEPVNNNFLGEQSKFEDQVLRAAKLVAVELFNGESIMCLIKSIPMRDILKNVGRDVTYRKVELTDETLLKKYQVSNLPALLFFESGRLLGKIEGFYAVENQNELLEKIKEVVK